MLVDFLWNFNFHIDITSKIEFFDTFFKYEIIFLGKSTFSKTNKGGFYDVPKFDVGAAAIFLLPGPVCDPADIPYPGQIETHACVDLPDLCKPDLSRLGRGTSGSVLGYPGSSGVDDDFRLASSLADRAHGGEAHHARDRGAVPDGGGSGVSERPDQLRGQGWYS